VFFDEIPSRLPPIRGIEHQINLITSALIHNRPAYQSKSQGNRKPSKKVEELMTNRYSFEMNEMSIILVLLTPKQVYDELQKLKKGKMTETESLYIRETLFANKVLLGFNDDCHNSILDSLNYLNIFLFLSKNPKRKHKFKI